MATHREVERSAQDPEKHSPGLTRVTVDQAAEYIFWTDGAGRIVYVNQSACRRYGYSKKEMIGLVIGDIAPNLSGRHWQERWRAIKKAGVSTIETTHRAKDGELFPVEVTAKH